ncbi:MAG: hypothetical protein ACXABK_01910 [Candidatus Heimdallarchaeaceae archaeon]|jgi:hypothetical protein
MGFRIFSVQKDGSYHEVSPVRESLVHEGDAFLIVDRKDKKIFIYRKLGISSALAYSAGRAATNLKTIRGSGYKVINIEQEDKDRVLTYILDNLESDPKTVVKKREIEEQQATLEHSRQTYVYGEQVRQPAVSTERETLVPQTLNVPEIEAELPKVELKAGRSELLTSYDVENILKTLASKMLFDTNIESVKSMDKPPRHQLRSELIKKIDSLLDNIY